MEDNIRPCPICKILERSITEHHSNEMCSELSRVPNRLEVVGLPNYGSKRKSAKQLVKWIKTAGDAVDIALFFIFHKAIIKAIINQRRKGVRFRIVVYGYVLIGCKSAKHQRYINMLMQAGVLIRWMRPFESSMPLLRVLMLDCVNTERTRAEVHGCFIYGFQSAYNITREITTDMQGLVLTEYPSNHRFATGDEFETIWQAAIESDDPNEPEPVPPELARRLVKFRT